MKEKATVRVRRTREEVLAWLEAARQRKKAWEQKVETKWAEEEQLKKEVFQSHFYDVDFS